MEYKDAIKTIEVAKAEVEWNYPLEYQEAFDIAIECIEKQIPKKPIRNTGNINTAWTESTGLCPICKTYVGNYDVKIIQSFCDVCGQATDDEIER